MAWGLVEPLGSGDYFPDGDYVGWEEKIRRYFYEEMSAQQRAKFDDWDVSYRAEIARAFTEDMGALEPHQQPRQFKFQKNPTSLSSLVKLNDRLLVVDETLKSIIETLESDVHQFWPLEFILRNGKDRLAPHYGMIIRQFRNSLVPELSEVRREDYPTCTFYYGAGLTKKDYARISVSRAKIDGAHLWREEMLRTPGILISDALQAEVTRRGLRIFKHHKLNEA